MTASGPLGLAGGAKQTVVTQSMNVGQRVLVPVEVDGTGLGIANISLKLVDPAASR